MICFLTFKTEASNPKVYCETIESANWTHGSSQISLKTCWIEDDAIDSNSFFIGNEKDALMGGLVISSNENVLYLPLDTAKVFPSIETYLAERCSIQEIFKENFSGLLKLRLLMLRHNKISKISSGTFDGLHQLETIELSKLFFS